MSRNKFTEGAVHAGRMIHWEQGFMLTRRAASDVFENLRSLFVDESLLFQTGFRADVMLQLT